MPTKQKVKTDQHSPSHGFCHTHRIGGVDAKARKKLIIVSVICLAFMIIEATGGIISNSLAIVSDAAHLLTDFASFMISLLAIWIAGKPSTRRMSFGWYRAEVIGAVVSVLLIWLFTGILVYLAILRIINRDFELEAVIMLITAGAAIVVNIIMGVILFYNPGHGHSHGGHAKSKPSPATSNANAERKKTSRKDRKINSKATADKGDHNADVMNGTTNDKNLNKIENNVGPSSSQSPATTSASLQKNSGDDHVTTSTGATMENINVRAAFVHVVGDALQSVGCFLAALVIYFKPEWAIADPICTFIFSIIVVYTTIHIMKDALLVLMEGTPSYLDYADVMQTLLEIDGVQKIHNLRMWALSINKIALAVHLAVKPGANTQRVLSDANNSLHQKYDFFETTIQIEDFTPEMEECQHCVLPKR